MGNILTSIVGKESKDFCVCFLNMGPPKQISEVGRPWPQATVFMFWFSSLLSRPFLGFLYNLCLLGSGSNYLRIRWDQGKGWRLTSFEMMKASDLESTRFYYLFIKKSVTDNNVRCSLPTWPEEKGHRGRKRTQPAGTLGSQKGREARVTPPSLPMGSGDVAWPAWATRPLLSGEDKPQSQALISPLRPPLSRGTKVILTRLSLWLIKPV